MMTFESGELRSIAYPHELRIYFDFVYLAGGGILVQVSKWGNSLAIRLPAAVVDALELKDGDQIEVRIASPREFEISRDPTREAAMERLRRLRRPLPPGFTFDRLAANER